MIGSVRESSHNSEHRNAAVCVATEETRHFPGNYALGRNLSQVRFVLRITVLLYWKASTLTSHIESCEVK